METDNPAFINLVWDVKGGKGNQWNASKDLLVCQCISGTETRVHAER